MRRQLGLDFGDVRIHTGPGAEASARAVGARAFTLGQHVVFGPGQFSPATSAGRGLLAHELAHVIQQRSTSGGTALAGFDIDPDDTAEGEARRVGEQVARSGGAGAADDGCSGTCAHTAVTTATAPTALQRSVCDDATRLHAQRAGGPAPPSAAAPAAQAPTTAAERRAESDAAWASAASTIDFALTILEHPLARMVLSTMPIPVVVPPQTRELVHQALPHVREIWELISDPVRLMTEVQGFVNAHLAGVPEEAQKWFADAAFESLRSTRHMVAINLALGDAIAELLSNWTAPFVTAAHEFIHPLDVEAEMADLACIQERYQTGGINTLEAFTAIYGWLMGWVNRYSVYVGIALVVGGAGAGALGLGVVGGAGGAAAGGVGAAPGAAVGGGGGAAAGAGAGWALSEELGIAILAANAVHMLLEVVSAGARLAENDSAAAEDARAGRKPSDATVEDRLHHDEEAYKTIAHVLLGLGIMGALVLLAAFGSQFARVAIKGLSRRYPSLGKWLLEAGKSLQESRVGRAAEEFQSGRRAMEQRLRGEPPTTPREPRMSTGTTGEISVGGRPHQVSVRNGRIWLCSDNCGALIEKLEAMLKDIPIEHPDRASFEEFLGDLRKLEADRGAYTPDDFELEVRVRSRRLESLAANTDPELNAKLVGEHLPEGRVQFDEDLDPFEEKYGEDPRNQTRRQWISDPDKMELEESDWLKKNLSRDPEPRRRFMKWLEATHKQGEEHTHLKPGSPYAESMLSRFKQEENL
jgi:hypothetical protein